MQDERIRVLVVYSELSHYRYGIFRAMDESAVLDCTFAAGAEGPGGIPSIPPALLRTCSPLTNHRAGRAMWQSGVIRLVARGKHDAVVFLGDASVLSTWFGAALARVMGRPVLFWTIGWHRPERGPKRIVRLLFYRLANGLLLYGNTALELGARMGYPRARMAVIYNSLPETSPADCKSTALSIDAALRSDAVVVGAVVRLTPAKRLDLLIEAAAELARRGTPVTVALAGDGPEREPLRTLAFHRGVDLRLLGPIYSPDAIGAVYQRIAVTVVPSAVGLTAIQSLSYGVPVITDDNPYTQMPEWEAIVPGQTGGHYRAGDHVDLADTIAAWLARQANSRTEIALCCKCEVRRRWVPSVQLERIEVAVKRLVGAGAHR